MALGVNIFFHGAVRFFGYSKFVGETVALFRDSPLPNFSVEAFVRVIPVAEVGLGLLILLGLFMLPALVGGLLLMIGLMIGMCTLQKWDLVGLQMNCVLMYALCIYTLDLNRFSVDQWMRHAPSRS